jgi:hypothetical protein
MNRRGFLGLLSALAFATPARAEEENKFFGALKPAFKSRRIPFRRAFGHFKGISKGQKAFLWKYLEIILGAPLKPHKQGGEGDCVGHAAGLGVDILAACDLFMRFEPETWKAKSSVEMIYTGSRNEIGGGDLEGRAGSHGEWAVKFLSQYGTLHRQIYASGDNYLDLRGYDVVRSYKMRDLGVPDWLEPKAKQHPVKTYSKILTVRDAFDSVFVGQPVILCSTYAFHDTRDKDGFCKPYLSTWNGNRWRGRWFRKQWWHALLLAGFKDDSRPGGLILNSHGAWNDGPTTYGQPPGSFWVDAEYLELMLKDWEDCYAMSAYVGHPQRMLSHKLY